ncbi:MAG TPA: abortive infection protein, partial [Micromonosporaceae bacterium]
QLRCNSVTIYGSDLDRLAETSAAAVEQGLHVWLQPRLVDRPQEEILDFLGRAARLAESLRQDGAKITFSVGAVHLVFTPGIVPGGKYHERMANVYAGADHNVLKPTGSVDPAAARQELNVFLYRASSVARDHFNGNIAYSAAPFEDVDWRLFDFIGLMYFYHSTYHPEFEWHEREVGRYRKWNKPIFIAEFGTGTYRGAAEKAFLSFDIVDRTGPVHLVLEQYVRNEQAQAEYHLKMFDMFERLDVHGVSVYEFIHPTHPHSTHPRLDLDAASMAIVKTIRDDYTNPNSTYRWEPKESFHAIATYNAACAGEPSA